MRVAAVRNMSDSANVYYKVYPLSEEADADAFVAAQLKKPEADQFSKLGWVTQDILMANGLTDFDPVFDAAQKVIKVKSVNNQAVFVLYVPEKTKPMKKVQIATLYKNVLPSDL